MTTSAVFRSMRPPFLILTPVCIFLGYAASVKYLSHFPYLNLSLTLIAAILAHISVNTFNEYFDYKSGLDALTHRTPFSGGSGALIDNPGALTKVGLAAVLSLGGTVAIGIYFLTVFGAKILPVGILGIVIILSYTQWLNKQAFLCLVAPGIAFGPLMVVGSALVFTGEFVKEAALVSAVPFFLVNNLLLLNQLPDIEADKTVGRKHFPIVFGEKRSVQIYGLFIVAEISFLIFCVYTALLPGWSLASLLPLSVGIYIYFGITKERYQIEKILPFLGMNVAITLVTPLVLGLSLLLGCKLG